MESEKILPIRMSNDTLPLDGSVYQIVIEEYVNNFSLHEGVIWIGQFGTVGNPGISDIDLIVICEEEQYTEVKRHSLEFIKETFVHQYTIWNGGLVFPKSAVKYLYYFHVLGNLHTLWGDPHVLDSMDQPDGTIVLFRNILLNSFIWNGLLRICQLDGESLRGTICLIKSVLTSASENYYRMGNNEYAEAITLRSNEARDSILNAPPSSHCALTKEYLWEATETLKKADWDLSNWLIEQNMVSDHTDQFRIQLSPEHTLVFCDHDTASQAGLHQHSGSKHITYLPYFYKTISTIIVQPYLEIMPSLSKIWGRPEKNPFENPLLDEAARKWNEALVSTFNGLKKAGGNPLELNGFPFYLGIQRSTIKTILRESVKKIIPRKTRQMLSERLQNL